MGFPFLPSVAWVNQSHAAAMLVGAIAAVASVWAGLKGLEMSGREHGPLRILLMFFVSPIFGYGFGYNGVTTGGPMLVAILAGHEVEVTFTVADVSMSSSSKCRNPIEIDELPFLSDRLCGYPEEVRKTLAPGARIAIKGRGSEWGVFAGQVRRID